MSILRHKLLIGYYGERAKGTTTAPPTAVLVPAVREGGGQVRGQSAPGSRYRNGRVVLGLLSTLQEALRNGSGLLHLPVQEGGEASVVGRAEQGRGRLHPPLQAATVQSDVVGHPAGVHRRQGGHICQAERPPNKSEEGLRLDRLLAEHC